MTTGKQVNEPAVSFLVPVMDELASLTITVNLIVDLIADELTEIIIILSPKSQPKSVALAKKLVRECAGKASIYWQDLPGIGGALAGGIERASGRYIMLMASDLETDPRLIPSFISKMREGESDIVCGSRWLKGGGFTKYGRFKQILNWLFQKLMNLLFGSKLTDYTYAYRLYRREVLEGIIWEEKGHPFLLESLLKPLMRGARTVEVPCQWQPRSEGVSQNSWRQMLMYLSLAARLKLRSLRRNGE